MGAAHERHYLRSTIRSVRWFNTGYRLRDPHWRLLVRYWVHDEYGALRGFWTRKEALHFMADGMVLVIKPKPPKPIYEEAPF